MTAHIIDGRALAQKILDELKHEIATKNLKPGLTVVLVGENPASKVYVASKEKTANELGMKTETIRLPAQTSKTQLLELIEKLNRDKAVHGILVQMPLPKHFGKDDEYEVLSAVNPAKDVDGFHYINAGKLSQGRPAFVPCTPMGCMIILQDLVQKKIIEKLDGLDAIVIGRSNIVGKPLGFLLLDANCTVTFTHSKTQNLADKCRKADIIVAAIGKPEFVQGDWVKDGAVVIDVGINRIADPSHPKGSRLVGDVAFTEAAKRATAITPVPGGVGPMTIACLMKNTVKAALNG